MMKGLGQIIREAGRARAVWPGEEKGSLINVCKHLMGGHNKEKQTLSSAQCQDKRQWT